MVSQHYLVNMVWLIYIIHIKKRDYINDMPKFYIQFIFTSIIIFLLILIFSFPRKLPNQPLSNNLHEGWLLIGLFYIKIII